MLPEPPGRTRSGPVTGKPAAPFALIAATSPVGRAIVAPGNVRMASTAPTEIAPAATLGVEAVYAPGPSFPAAATTTTPALTALSTAIASGESAVPNVPPTDRLITSIRFCTAQSIASSSASVLPTQPKTLRA